MKKKEWKHGFDHTTGHGQKHLMYLSAPGGGHDIGTEEDQYLKPLQPQQQPPAGAIISSANLDKFRQAHGGKKESGIEGNLPTWEGASEVYSRAYAYLNKNGFNERLIKALDSGDERLIKDSMLDLSI